MVPFIFHFKIAFCIEFRFTKFRFDSIFQNFNSIRYSIQFFLMSRSVVSCLIPSTLLYSLSLSFSVDQSFDTANQRIRGRAEFFQRFKLAAATNRLSKFKISSENTRSFEMNFEKLQLFCVKPTTYNFFFSQKWN